MNRQNSNARMTNEQTNAQRNQQNNNVDTISIITGSTANTTDTTTLTTASVKVKTSEELDREADYQYELSILKDKDTQEYFNDNK